MTRKDWLWVRWRPKKIMRWPKGWLRATAKRVSIREWLKQLDTKSMSEQEIKDKAAELAAMFEAIERRKKKFAIVDTRLDKIPKQKLMFDTMKERLTKWVRNRIRFYLYFWWNGAGKCWGLNEPMLMHNWTWKNAWELQVWDLLMGVDSTPRKVEYTYRWKSELYKITPESWEPIIVNWWHQLMLVHRRRDRKWKRNLLQDEYSHLWNLVPEWKLVQISVEDYLAKSTKWKAEAYMWRPKIIKYPTKQLNIDPYFMGLWLWDWSSNKLEITNIDKEVIDYIYEYAEKLWLWVSVKWISYNIRKNKKSRYWFNWIWLLRWEWVLNNKHIPLNYKTSSEEQRLEILAWLIDSDWEFSWNHKTPRYSITQKNKKLAYDILDLARSLWFRCWITEETKVCTNSTREDYIPWKYFRVSINWDVWRIPCKIERKKAINKARRHDKDWLVSKFLVEQIGEWEYVWFTLDWDKLHMDRNFIVHHNTLLWAYLTVLLALWRDWAKYNLPYIGTKNNIWILTKSWSNVKSVIHPYLLWDYSKTKIPEDMIEKVNLDNGILKWILLKNWCEIHVKTYDQGSENLQGWSPDWVWLDEEPVKEDVFTEILARIRSVESEMLVTMTPLSWLTKIYEYFLEQESDEVKTKSMVVQVSSMDNPFTDKTWALWLTDEEYKLRVIGTFENPTWLVYSSFHRQRHVIPHIEPKEFDDWMKYYRSIDFGTSHPTAVIFLAQDKDDNFYVFDEIREWNMSLDEIVTNINKKSKGYEFVYTIRDSAAKREWLEVERLWLQTTPADKHSKWVWDMSNRRTWILYINTLFKNNKLFISDRCKLLIKELETHYYKEGWKRDWEVNKENDDLLDALRYAIFMIRHNKTKNKTIFDREFEKKYSPEKDSSFRML